MRDGRPGLHRCIQINPTIMTLTATSISYTVVRHAGALFAPSVNLRCFPVRNLQGLSQGTRLVYVAHLARFHTGQSISS